MNHIYLYYCDRKELKKLRNLSYTMQGLSFWHGNDDVPIFCGFKLSNKLERKMKLFTFSEKKPRKLQFLYNVTTKSKIYTENEFNNFCQEEYTKRSNKTYKLSNLNIYNKMPKGITKDNKENYNTGSGYNHGTCKCFCTKCHFSFKTYKYPIGNRKHRRTFIRYKEIIKCQNCGSENSVIYLNSSIRVPKKEANKKVWDNFYELFIIKRRKKT